MPIGSEARRAGEVITAEGLGAGSLSPEIMQLFQQFMSSPAGQAALTGANQLGNQVNSATATSLGRSGLSTTGVGGVRLGLAAGAGAQAKQGARAGFFGQAVGAAASERQNRLQALLQLIGIQKNTEAPDITGKGFARGAGRAAGSFLSNSSATIGQGG